jgi:mannose-1-phosphate guanylyltransferase
VEKPNKELAQKYIDNGNFLWNSGIFCFTAKTFLQEMEKYNPLIVTYVNSSMPHLLNKNHKDIELNSISFNLVPEESIDYALMEKTDKLKVVACNIGWKDVGTWKSLGDLQPADAFGNRIKGKAILHNVSDCYIENNGQLIGAVGVKNLAIIGTEDGFLVTNKESAEEVKNIYSKLHIKNNIKEFFWGKIIPMKEISGMRFNRIEINIGVMVDLKKYFKYSANWIVLKGEAQFFEEGVRSTEMIINSSKYIRNGQKILLNNIGKSTLIMITIELDDYLCKNAIIAS